MGYQNRRYLVVDGKLKKSWVNPPPAGWFKEKADALADNEKKISEERARDDALAAEKANADAPAPPDAATPPAPPETPAATGGESNTNETPEVEAREPGTAETAPEKGPTPAPYRGRGFCPRVPGLRRP